MLNRFFFARRHSKKRYNKVKQLFSLAPFRGKGWEKGLFGAALLLLFSCGPSGDRCELDGRFLKMNQGEFRVYSPDGSITGVDTIHVSGGRFEYEMECKREGTIVIVLPNFTELPVFVAPGKTIKLRADATSIKDIEIKGTEENKLMTEWRNEFGAASTQEQQRHAEQFIRQNPASQVSCWLLYKCFVAQQEPDYKKIEQLTAIVTKANPGAMAWWTGNASTRTLPTQTRLATFNATDVYGRSVSSADYMSGYTLIMAWATVSFDSQSFNRQVKSIYSSGATADNGAYAAVGGIAALPETTAQAAKFKALSVCLDPSKEEAKKTLHNDSLPWPTICDGQMWQSSLVKKLGFTTLPDNILLKDGKVVARHLKFDELRKKLEGK